MTRLGLAGIAFVTLAGLAVAAGGAAVADDPPAPGPHRWMEMRAALFDAHLEGMKAGLRLTPDQQKAWAPFETAVRDVAKERAQAMRAARSQWEANDDERPTLIDRLHAMSDRLATRSSELRTIADAAAPLYASLDDGQKRIFAALFHELAAAGRRGAHAHEEAR
jgi:zinc resistance-associated protein